MIHTNSKGFKYYLHRKTTVIGRNKVSVATHFFCKDKRDGYCSELPAHLTVIETQSGLPFVKKK